MAAQTVRIEQLFSSAMPPEGFLPWARLVTVPGTSMASIAVGGVLSVPVYKTGKAQSLLITSIIPLWLESGLDPILVLSGVTDREAIKQYPYRPRLVLNGVGDIVPQA